MERSFPMHLTMWKLVFNGLLTILRYPRESVLNTESQANKSMRNTNSMKEKKYNNK